MADMTKIQTIDVQYFDPPLDEVLEDAKHGAHTHFELVTVTGTNSKRTHINKGTKNQLRAFHSRTLLGHGTFFR